MVKIFKMISCAFVLVFCFQAAFADEMDEPGKQIMQKAKSRIVGVKVVASEMNENGKQEMKIESQGLLIDENGTVLVAYSSIDPIKFLARMFEVMGLGGQAGRLKNITSNIDDVKLITNDGKEIQAKIILTDKDLDVAIIKPEKEGEKFDFFEVSNIDKPALFDKVIVLFRLNKDFNRELTFVTSQVNTLLTKPESLFTIEGGIPTGCFVFNRDGRFIGVTVARESNSEGEGADSSLGITNSMVSTIIPAKEILDTIKQAKEKIK